ncbi:MAG: YbgC/FadM family acyl-CoA thioesterase [Deltaproteobacteria bacterium]|nr:YbgC/FadM family acyl-CoA thioesterase [Deltaproteobacteria bacterium]
MGVVYYANYLAFFERGRCEYMRERAFDYGAFEKQGFVLPVTEASVKYRQPARFDDLLIIETVMTAASRITATFGYRVSREADGTLLVEGSTTHACLTREGRPVRWPAPIKALMPSELFADAGLDREPAKTATSASQGESP